MSLPSDTPPALPRRGIGKLVGAGRATTPSTRILVGLALGIVTGLLIGDEAAALGWAADGYVKLLQMTVLPYVTLSIIGNLGKLSLASARALAWRAGAVLAAIWGIALLFAMLIPLTFPAGENASFFSTTLVERRPPFDFVALYIPSNPFYSLANNIVPAVVLFSVIVGVALIGVPKKEVILEPLAVAAAALSRATTFIVGLTPYGLFAIAAVTAGTMSLEQLGRLQVYLMAYVLVALLVSLWVLPGLVAALTPIRMRDVFALTRNALITAFVAGDLFIVLPVLIASSRTLIERYELAAPPASGLPDVIVPASFNFPHAGKLLSISFVLFAGWFADAALALTDYPRLAVMGVLTFFGSLNVAVPFLLDAFRIPADTFQLFLASGVINSRFGTLLAAMHTVTVALLGTCAMTQSIRWERPRLIRYGMITLALTLATIGGTRVVFAQILRPSYTKDQVLAGMHARHTSARAVIHRETPAPPAPVDGSVLDGIRSRGRLRVGYLGSSLPFAFFNGDGDLVGFDIDLAYRLAAELGVQLELMPIERATLDDDLAAGLCDLVMSGVAVTPLRASRTLFSSAYLDETFALVVEDGRRGEFATWNDIRRRGRVRIAVPDVPYYVAKIQELAPGADIQRVTDIEALLKPGAAAVDAMAIPAERGSAWTLIYPKFSVVVPDPERIRIPLAYPLARADERFARFVDTWIELKRKDGTLQAMYDYWILGRNAQPPTRRWSLVRNVLHWVE